VSSRIKILPSHLINQIAAGEVVERPSSIVKELVENSIDARATQIDVELLEAGKKKIVIRDNGCGMTKEEVELCIERYATSKINILEDLFKVKTLGFRGEALPSIASVSYFTLISKTKDTVEATKLFLEGGKKQASKIVGAPIGTEIQVEDLFFNTPARLKFLKSNATELSHCIEIVEQLALAHPMISFKLVHQEKDVFFLPRATLLERILAVLKEKPEVFVPIENNASQFHLSGYVGLPRFMGGTSRQCYTFVNRRPVRDRTLLHAISAAYQSFVPQGHYPKVVLFLETEGEDVDVNVHPAKREVRFKETHFVHSFVEKSIRQVLGQLRSAGDKLNSHVWLGGAEGEAPSPRPQFTRTDDGESPSATGPKDEAEGTDSYFSLYPPDHRIQVLREGATEAFTQTGYYRNLHYIGQIKSSYLLCEDKDELIFIDQHAAHERVAFEKLRKQYRDSVLQQQYLLVPISLEVTQEEAVLLTELSQELSQLGFEIEPFGGTTFLIKAVPSLLHDHISIEVIRSVIHELKEVSKTLVGDEIINHHLATLACHSARTAKEKLSREEVSALLSELDQIKVAPHCPHGRPFDFRVPIVDIEKYFRR